MRANGAADDAGGLLRPRLVGCNDTRPPRSNVYRAWLGFRVLQECLVATAHVKQRSKMPAHSMCLGDLVRGLFRIISLGETFGIYRKFGHLTFFRIHANKKSSLISRMTHPPPTPTTRLQHINRAWPCRTSCILNN